MVTKVKGTQYSTGISTKKTDWFTYTIDNTSATTYKITLTAGTDYAATSPSSWDAATVYITGTGQTTKHGSIAACKTGAVVTIKTAISSFTWTYTKGTSAANKTITAYSAGHSNTKATKTFTVPALAKYTITYKLNGGTGTFANGTKYYGKPYTIPSAKPTRTGYTFVRWVSSGRTDGTVYFQPGNTTNYNGNQTLTAEWKVNQYTVSYNANGGTGTIANQTKTYGTTAYFKDSTGFTKKEKINNATAESTFVNWNTKADNTGSSYAPGDEIPNITTNLTAYAQWRLDYIYPSITNYNVIRTADTTIGAEGVTESDDGTHLYITADLTQCSSDGGTTWRNPAILLTVDNTEYTPTFASNFQYLTAEEYSSDVPHTVTLKVYDSTRTTSTVQQTIQIATAILPIDLYGEGNNVYMGIMHPYVTGNKLTLSEAVVDGAITIPTYRNSSWVAQRDSALLKFLPDSTTTLNTNYHPYISMKGMFGDWTVGPYVGSVTNPTYENDSLYLTYITDTNYENGTNTTTGQLRIRPEQGLQLSPNWDYYVHPTTLALGTYIATGILTGGGSMLLFSIPTGRVFPAGTSISKITFGIIGRVGNSNASGLYIIKSTSGGSSAVTFDSSKSCTFYNGNNVQKTVTTDMWDVKTIHGHTNLYFSISGPESSYFFSGTSTINGYVNNQPVALFLSNINVTFSYS